MENLLNIEQIFYWNFITILLLLFFILSAKQRLQQGVFNCRSQYWQGHKDVLGTIYEIEFFQDEKLKLEWDETKEFVEENDETNEEGFDVYQQSSSFHV
jgi:hypothetical protein